MSASVVVDYLVMEPEPHLQAQQCAGCFARFVQARAACPSCGGRSFTAVPLPPTGAVRTFSVVRRAPYDALVPPPYIPAVVELSDGTSIAASLVGVAPEDVTSGLPVELTVFDTQGDAPRSTFGFRPVSS